LSIAATRKIRKQLWEAYGWFVAAYWEEADKLRKGDRNAILPAGQVPAPSDIRSGLSPSSGPGSATVFGRSRKKKADNDAKLGRVCCTK